MKKVLLCSHESDADGIGAVVLAKIAFDNLDYKLFQDPNDLEIKFRELIKSGVLDDYDRIYITDLSLLEPSISMVNDSNLRDKLLVFDHHQRGIELGLRKYPFTTIIEEDESGKRCGTELFYRYLIREGLMPYKLLNILEKKILGIGKIMEKKVKRLICLVLCSIFTGEKSMLI